VKICGLTQVEQAVHCVKLGADLVGLVFYPGSPRYVDRKLACEISAAVGSQATVVGVFVNESYRAVMDTVKSCSLSAVQLHGQEPPELVKRLQGAGLVVLKALFHSKQPFLDQAVEYDASAFLLECGAGLLPGGNARTWDWAAAEKINRSRPVILAGGLNADNVSRAIQLGKPDALDVSSGVEHMPGAKDMNKVAAFLDAVGRTDINYKFQRIR
jgi:phosphoribosylanthranilate isomerase